MHDVSHTVLYVSFSLSYILFYAIFMSCARNCNCMHACIHLLYCHPPSSDVRVAITLRSLCSARFSIYSDHVVSIAKKLTTFCAAAISIIERRRMWLAEYLEQK
jgi:hypothetical protein